MCYVDHLWLLVMNENVDEIRAPHRYNPWCSGSDRVSSYTSPSLLNVFLISVIVCTFQQFAWSAAHFIRCFLTYNQARNIQCKQMKYFCEVLISPNLPCSRPRLYLVGVHSLQVVLRSVDQSVWLAKKGERSPTELNLALRVWMCLQAPSITTHLIPSLHRPHPSRIYTEMVDTEPKHLWGKTCTW